MKTTILSLLLLIVNNVFSQIVTENVNFNNYVSSTNNDLTNNFIFSTFATPNFLTQSNSGGITGGALIPTSTNNWGNDIIKYCSTYKNLINSMIETSICFKFNSALVNPNASERAIAIWMYGDSTNHNICFHLDYGNTNVKSIIITGYNYTPSQPPYITLVNGHWYKFVGQYVPVGGNFGDEVSVKAEVFDLGLNGVSIPTSIGNLTATIYDLNLVSSTKYILGISGAKWGGSEYIDNFTFKGEKKGTICNNLGINQNIIDKNDIQIYPNPTKDNLNIKSKTIIKLITIYNNLGQVLTSIPQNSNEIKIDLSYLPTNNYFIKIESDDKKELFKIIKE